MGIDIFTQFGVRAGGSVEFAYAFSTPTAYVNDNTCSPSGYTVCNEDNFVESGNNTRKECQCVFGAWVGFTTRSSFTSSLPACGQGVVQSRALQRTRTGATSSFSYSERTTYSGTLVSSGWTCNTFQGSTTTQNVTSTSCVYTVTDEFVQSGTCTGQNYDRGCLSSGTRGDCRSVCQQFGLQAFIQRSSCTVQTTTTPVTTCTGGSFTGSFNSSSNQSSSATPGNGCVSTSCSQNQSCSGLNVSYQQFAFGQCTGTFYNDDCNFAVCNNYSGTSCNFSGWSGWGQVSSCTSASPGCSNGAVQVECASETRTGQLQSRTSVCNRTEVS